MQAPVIAWALGTLARQLARKTPTCELSKMLEFVAHKCQDPVVKQLRIRRYVSKVGRLELYCGTYQWNYRAYT